MNRALAPEQVFLTASFTATPAAASIDGVVGLSSNPAAAFNDLAAAVRFNPQGTIDVRGTSAYGVELVVPYAAVHPYTFQLITDVLGHSYSVLLGGELIARASGFRAQQAAVASLANQALTVDSPAGPLTMCDVVVSPAKGVLYAHDMNTFQPATLPQSLAALPNGTMLLADQTRTLTLDAQGKVIHTAPHGGFVATDGAGNAYLVGSFTGTYDGGGGPMVSAGGVDAYVSKYGPGWNHLWSRTLGGAGDDAAAAPAVNARGDVLLGVGATLIRLNPDGTTAWSSASSVGAIALDPTGNAIFNGPPDAVRSIAIAKVDRNGKAVWNRHFPITQGGAGLQLIRTDTSGNVIFSGGINGSVDFGVAQLTARSSEDGDQIFVAKLDSTGAYVYGAIGNLHVLRSLAVDSAGNALVAGYHVNVDHPVLDEFGPTGSGLHEWLGTEVSPVFQFGSSGTLLMTDSARNIYWQLSPRIGSGNGLDYLVKLAP